MRALGGLSGAAPKVFQECSRCTQISDVAGTRNKAKLAIKRLSQKGCLVDYSADFYC